jgi:hypothetical protein
VILTNDASRVSDAPDFQEVDKTFGLSSRLYYYNLYAAKGDKDKAVIELTSAKGVLDGHESKRETIREKDLIHAAGTVLVAIDYDLLTIKGVEQHAIPFNELSTDESIVLSL